MWEDGSRAMEGLSNDVDLVGVWNTEFGRRALGPELSGALIVDCTADGGIVAIGRWDDREALDISAGLDIDGRIYDPGVSSRSADFMQQKNEK